MLDFLGYNREWLVAAQNGKTPFNDASNYGVVIHPLRPDVAYFDMVIGVHHLTPDENGGNHNIYVDVLDEAGNRRSGAKLEVLTEFGYRTQAVIDKPANEPGTNFPMWDWGRTSVYTVNADNVPSDMVSGLHYKHNDEGDGNTWGHHSFYVCFLRMTTIAPPPDPPIELPTPIDTIAWLDDVGVDKTSLYTRTALTDIEALLDTLKTRVTRWNE